jgi:copper chaperone
MCTACSCTTDTATTTDGATPSGDVSEYRVTGMTCGHCVGSVTEQIQQIEGVRDVAVDLSTGAVLVTADRPVSADAVASAVREAGYQLA